jgi:hypothetical protein
VIFGTQFKIGVKKFPLDRFAGKQPGMPVRLTDDEGVFPMIIAYMIMTGIHCPPKM